MYDLVEENSVEALEECYELCKNHFYELGEDHNFQPFEVDWSTLKAFLSAGMLSILIARKDGKIAGYFMNLLSKDFMTSKLIGKELAIYVDKPYRGGKLFLKMVKATEQLLKDRGAVTQYITFVEGHNEKLPLKLGFSPLEVTYKKDLEAT